jgi:uncharacterized SAM-binding protein YcdF (DUF218 family)
MFFFLSKVLGFFATPSNLMIVVGLVGIGLLGTRFARTGRRLMAASLLALALAGFSPLGNALILPLEQRFPPWDATRGAPDGIVVLGGAVSPDVSAARGVPALNEAAERMTVVAELARRYPAARIVFTGGSGNLIFGGAAEADAVMALFESFGIPRERVTLEGRSRNTVENARFTKELMRPKPGERWLLVTSAHHMPRSIGVFRHEDFLVEAYPVDWRTRGPEDLWLPFGALSGGLSRTDTALHEWVGLLGYRISGQTSELYPGPPAR